MGFIFKNFALYYVFLVRPRNDDKMNMYITHHIVFLNLKKILEKGSTRSMLSSTGARCDHEMEKMTTEVKVTTGYRVLRKVEGDKQYLHNYYVLTCGLMKVQK